nr:hypothetical protein 2 [Mute swan feces associated picorna-like virus 29]
METLGFTDKEPGYDYSVPSMPDSTFNLADAGDGSLENFFSRPVKIASYGWGTGTNLFETFNPWKLFWENPRVINRVTNYNLLRSKLCVKFVLNGNGFYYGRAIASYIPLHNQDFFTKDRAFFIEDVVEASQRPHIYLDPTNSQGGTMCLPFVLRTNAMDIPEAEWDDMGDIIIHGMQQLKHANDASGTVTVSVFAWAEDVSLSIPTANEPGALSPQAGELGSVPSNDEYGKGIISAPATFVAKAAGLLSQIPAIKPYATATQIGASAIASIARSFGFSRPIDIEPIRSYKPNYLGNMANANATDTSNKLTFDAKQELTVDTRTFGLDGTDEMAITSISTRESFLTQFSWPVSSSSETLLWNTEVNPVVWNELTVGENVEYHMPACCFAALPFRHWRGTMKYRFQVVASAFHKGRLKIVYDPSYPLTNEYNTNYVRIIDLAEERDFTCEVGWGQQYPFLQHRPMLNGSGEIFDTSALGADPAIFANGILSIYVVNELTVPNSIADNDIEINVFVKTGDDFEVINPDDQYTDNLSWYAPQSGELDYGAIFSQPIIEVETEIGDTEVVCTCCPGRRCTIHEVTPQAGELGNVPDSDNTTEENAPMQMQVDETMAPTDQLSSADNTHAVFFGDPVQSIRQVLKRYNYSRTTVPPTTGDGFIYWLNTINNFPLYRGYVSDGVDQALGPLDYNFVRMTMVNYYTPAYTCWRGGIRWKYHLLSDNSTEKSSLMVSRDTTSATSYSQQAAAIPDNNTGRNVVIQFLNGFLPTLHDGGHVTAAEQNPVVEAELPFHSPYRFFCGKQGILNLNLGVDSLFHRVIANVLKDDTSHTHLNSYVATAEDFTLGFYTGPPVAYYQPSPVPAS